MAFGTYQTAGGGLMGTAIADQMNQKAPQATNMSGLFPGASGGIQNILSQLTQSQNQANQANQQRYKDVLQMYSGMGQSGAQQIAEQTQQQQAKGVQSMTSRGLGNTTVTDATSRGIASEGQNNLLALQESLAGKEAGVMENMTQKGPDLSMYANLIAAAMKGSVGQAIPQIGGLSANWGGAQTGGGGGGGNIPGSSEGVSGGVGGGWNPGGGAVDQSGWGLQSLGSTTNQLGPVSGDDPYDFSNWG